MDPAIPVTDSFTQFEFARAPAAWWRLLALAALIALAAWTWHSYRRQARGRLSTPVGVLLIVLRLGAVLLLAVIALDPVQARYEGRTQRSGVALLVDHSASMSARDVDDPAAGRMTRFEALRTRLNGDPAGVLAGLHERNDLRVYAFGENVAEVEPPRDDGAPIWARAALPFEADSGATDLGRALRRAALDLGGGSSAAFIVLSDGGVNAGLTPDELAALARRAGAPLYALAVGADQLPPNRSIAAVHAPLSAALGDPIEVRVDLAAAAIDEQRIPLELWREPLDAPGEPELIEQREVRLGGEFESLSESFRVDFAAGGEFVLTARIPDDPLEVLTRDNQRSALVRVDDDKLRVLLIAGRPSYDVRAVARLLERDALVNLSIWLQSADPRAVRDGDTIIEELPRTPEQLFAYDAILLMDPEPGEFDAAWALTVRRFVDEFNGGLVVQAGGHFTTRMLADQRLDELVTMLPIRPDPQAALHQSRQGAFGKRAMPLIVPDDARDHPLLVGEQNPAQAVEAWRAMPGLWWRLPVLGEKPLARVLLRIASGEHAGDAPPLLTIQPFGGGRTAFLTSDDTWRWRAADEARFDRFWVQLTRYVAQGRRQQGASRRGQITLDRDVIRRGDVVSIQARVLDERFVPWQAPRVTARIIPTDAQPEEIELLAVPGREGWFAAQTRLDWFGRGRVRITLPDALPDDPEGELSRRIHVFEPTTELDSLALRTNLLKRLADETGGALLTLADFERLPEMIPDATVHTSVRTGAEALWDSPWVYSLLGLLLTTEWLIRRRNHLL